MHEESESNLERLTGTIGDLVTGIPAPIRKNFFKAFSQLCTAAVDVPIAKLESYATEIRANSTARVKIIQSEGEKIAKQLNIPKEYIEKASEKFASKIVNEQLNLDRIGIIAANELNQKNSNETYSDNISEINDDWLNEFENYAKLKSSDDMRLIFGKILSGEIRKPGTFSIRTIRLISQLDNEAAKLFRILCSISVSLRRQNYIIDARVITFNKSAGQNGLRDFGLSFTDLNILNEYGLINSEYNSSASYGMCIPNNHDLFLKFTFENKSHILSPQNESFDKKMKINGVSLTKVGQELLSIIPFETNLKYRKKLIEFFENRSLKMTIVE